MNDRVAGVHADRVVPPALADRDQSRGHLVVGVVPGDLLQPLVQFAEVDAQDAAAVFGAPVRTHGVPLYTDARHYADLSENIFRFLPLRLNADDLKRMHGIDERVGIRDYEMAIRMYRQLVVNTAAK